MNWSFRESMDITKPWPMQRETVDGITSMHVLQELPWRSLTYALIEMYRVLKPDGVLRLGVPHIDSGKELDYFLGWGNINLLSEELLAKVLTRTGFSIVESAGFRKTASHHPIIIEADNRQDETLYLEAFKSEEGCAS